MTFVIFNEPPKDFKPHVEVSGCFIEWSGKFLFLKRAKNSPQGGTFGLPAGKHEKEERPVDAVMREVKEETALDLENVTLLYHKALYVRRNGIDYIFHVFSCKIQSLPSILLDPNEHDAYEWLTLDEAKSYPLIDGGIETIEHYKLKRGDEVI